MFNSTTSCLVPLYNENERIFVVLEALLKVKSLKEIIVIDDGSTINITQKLRKKYPGIKVFRFEINHGKSGAVFEGLKICQTENVLLFDADLFDIDVRELREAVEYFSRHREWDMIILRRMKDPWISKLIRTDIVTSGQRLLRTKDLKELAKTSLKNFQLELAINDYMLNHQKKVGWLPLVCRDIRKAQKYGLIKGNYKDFLMFVDLLSYKGLLYFFKLLFTFCQQEIKDINY